MRKGVKMSNKVNNYPGFIKMLRESWALAFPDHKAEVFEPYLSSAGVVRAAETIAVELWKKGISADSFPWPLQELQNQLNYLHEKGQWDFRGYNHG